VTGGRISCFQRLVVDGDVFSTGLKSGYNEMGEDLPDNYKETLKQYSNRPTYTQTRKGRNKL